MVGRKIDGTVFALYLLVVQSVFVLDCVVGLHRSRLPCAPHQVDSSPLSYSTLSTPLVTRCALSPKQMGEFFAPRPCDVHVHGERAALSHLLDPTTELLGEQGPVCSRTAKPKNRQRAREGEFKWGDFNLSQPTTGCPTSRTTAQALDPSHYEGSTRETSLTQLLLCHLTQYQSCSIPNPQLPREYRVNSTSTKWIIL